MLLITFAFQEMITFGPKALRSITPNDAAAWCSTIPEVWMSWEIVL
jgi:hypothetical protein